MMIAKSNMKIIKKDIDPLGKMYSLWSGHWHRRTIGPRSLEPF